MSARKLPELLAERLALVTEIARIAGARQQAQVAAGGAEIDALGRQRAAAGRAGDTQDGRQALDGALARDTEARETLHEYDARIHDLECRIADIDEEIAGT